MIIKVVFIQFIIISQLFARSHEFKKEEDNLSNVNSLYFSEIHSIPNGSVNHVYFTYRISFARLVFIKSNDKYSASFKFLIEETDSASNNIVRQIQNKSIYIDSFNESVNEKNYYQGVIRSYLKNGIYKFLPFLTDLNTGHETKLFVKKLKVQNKVNSYIISLLIIKSRLVTCNNVKHFEIANFRDSFPFIPNEYSLLIRCTNTKQKSIFVEIKNNSDTVFSSDVNYNFKSKINLSECEVNIVLGDEMNQTGTRNFVIPEINNKLMEGNTEIIVCRTNDSVPLKIFNKLII